MSVVRYLRVLVSFLILAGGSSVYVGNDIGACLRWLTKIAVDADAKYFFGKVHENPGTYVVHIDSSGALSKDGPVAKVFEGKLIADPSSFLLWLKNRGEAFEIIGHIASVDENNFKASLVFRNSRAYERFRDITMTGIDSFQVFEEGSFNLKSADLSRFVRD